MRKSLLRGRSALAMRVIITSYPCRCLCFEFSQITRTTPRRWMILHLSQIFLTEALTFIIPFPVLKLFYFCCDPKLAALFIAIHNPSPAQLVWRKLHSNLVTRPDAHKVFAHASGNMCQHLVFVGSQLHPEHSVRQ